MEHSSSKIDNNGFRGLVGHDFSLTNTCSSEKVPGSSPGETTFFACYLYYFQHMQEDIILLTFGISPGVDVALVLVFFFFF